MSDMGTYVGENGCQFCKQAFTISLHTIHNYGLTSSLCCETSRCCIYHFLISIVLWPDFRLIAMPPVNAIDLNELHTG